MRFRTVVGVVAVIAAAATATVVGCGSDGSDGAAGAAGGNGANGNDGQQGAQGAQGSQGASGTSADGGIKVPYNAADDLKLTLDTATIDANQVATIGFHLTDAKGVPVTLPITSDGRIGTLAALPDGGTGFTADQVAISFVMAWLDQSGTSPLYYTPYTLRAVNGGSVDAGTAFKAATDSGGKFAAAAAKGDGYYTYTLATKIAVGANGSKTHTVGAYATRTIPGVTEPYVSNAELSFLPAGGAVTVTREVVKRENCNACHGEMGHHGSTNRTRQDITLCILCHSPSTTDLTTGNTINFGPMIHKLHYSSKLPSIQEKDAGVPIYPYGIGHDDYSDINFPQDIGNCGKCHDGAKTTTPFQMATIDTCTSCHDRTYFGASAPTSPASTKWTLHKLGQPINPDDKVNGGPYNGQPICMTCHQPGGLYDPVKFHGIRTYDPSVKIYSAKFVSTANGNAALQVEFDLTVADNTQKPGVVSTNDPTKLGAGTSAQLGFYFGGLADNPGSIGDGGTIDASASPSFNGANPVVQDDGGVTTSTTLYAWRASGAATHGVISGPNAQNHLVFTTNRADYDTFLTPTGLTGTWEVAATATAQAIAVNGVAQPRFYANNDVYYLNAATNTQGTMTTIVDVNGCNSCHKQVPGHGGSRNDPRVCQICHTPNRGSTSRPGDLANTAGAVAVGQPLDVKAMIHGIHLGDERTPGNTWFVGTNNNFTDVRYPDKRNNCEHCHFPGKQGLPLATPTQIATVGYTLTCTTPGSTSCSTVTATPYYTPPATAACTACHDSVSSKAHATLMTVNASASTKQSLTNPTGFAESCDTCHGAGKQYDVILMHQLR